MIYLVEIIHGLTLSISGAIPAPPLLIYRYLVAGGLAFEVDGFLTHFIHGSYYSRIRLVTSL